MIMTQDEDRFLEVTEELFTRLGYENILVNADENKNIGLVKMCSVFKGSKNFLPINMP